MFKKAFVSWFLLTALVSAQEAATISQHFKPGDSLHYSVGFGSDAELDGVTVQFRLQTARKKDQESLQDAFDVDKSLRVSAGPFEVSGTIPKGIASGTYQLIYVFARHGALSHTYQYPNAFTEKLMIEVVNNEGFEFPKIKAITPK